MPSVDDLLEALGYTDIDDFVKEFEDDPVAMQAIERGRRFWRDMARPTIPSPAND